MHLRLLVYHIKGKILYKGQLLRSCCRLNRFAGYRSESLFNRLVVAKHSNLVQFTQSNFFTNKTLSNLILFTCCVKLATANLVPRTFSWLGGKPGKGPGNEVGLIYQWMVWFKISNSTYPINSFKVAQNNSQHFHFNHSSTVGAAIIVSKKLPYHL